MCLRNSLLTPLSVVGNLSLHLNLCSKPPPPGGPPWLLYLKLIVTLPHHSLGHSSVL